MPTTARIAPFSGATTVFAQRRAGDHREPAGPYRVEVPPRRTLHLRFKEPSDPEPITRDTDFAGVIESDVPIVDQHTRLDSRQSANALLSTMACGEPGGARTARFGVESAAILADGESRAKRPRGRRSVLAALRIVGDFGPFDGWNLVRPSAVRAVFTSPFRPVPYAPIDSYGLIGNMRTAALVGREGSIDWLCLPHFDSPSVFAAILDHKRGGCFRIYPRREAIFSGQFYLPDTNVLMTRVRTVGGVGEIIDFMPVCLTRHDEGRPDLVRIVRVDHGEMYFGLSCRPAFNYARDSHKVAVLSDGAVFDNTAVRLGLGSTVPLEAGDDGSVHAQFTVKGGQSAAFALWSTDREQRGVWRFAAHEAEQLLDDTIDYWRTWLRRCTYAGRWRESVHRSALALKLLTFEPTGAIVAAPTCSLPEHIGGSRNWDYRFTWIRDAAFIIYALLRIGFTEEAAAFMDWLQQRSHELEQDRMLLPLYGIDGRHQLPEEELHHLEGYRGSGPVRIGNAACEQLQLDVVGTLIDAAFVYDQHAVPMSHDLWVELRKLLNWTCRNWTEPDNGVWEVRSEQRHFVYSKLMCWVALDRGIKLANLRSFPGDIEKWRENRDALYEEIMTRGWNRDRGAFVQHYDDDALDAANLVMPLVHFIAPNDPRMLSTIRAMDRPLEERGLISDFLVHRYDPKTVDDGVGGPEGGFNMCTFWLVEALTRAGRVDRLRLEKARLLFERALKHASPLGLFAEQTGMDGSALGNYPQGLTHLSLIVAAYHLDRALDLR